MPNAIPEEDEPLERQKHNQEAVILIMELYSTDAATATELWQRFIGTVIKMKKITESVEAR